MNRRRKTYPMPRKLVLYSLLPLLLIIFLGSVSTAQENSVNRTALLIIDVQEFYFSGGALPLDEPELAARNAGRVLQEFRKAGDLVVHVGHNVAQGGEFHGEVLPVAGEKIFHKDDVNSFQGTDLLIFLQQQKVTHLVILGMQTHMCLEGAVRAAHDLGFECTVISDACATRDLKMGLEVVPARQVHLSTLATLRGSYATVIDTNAWLHNH